MVFRRLWSWLRSGPVEASHLSTGHPQFFLPVSESAVSQWRSCGVGAGSRSLWCWFLVLVPSVFASRFGAQA